MLILSTILLASTFGCSRSYIIGKDVKEEAISDFYWTLSTSTFPPHYQRYRLYKEGDSYYFYHETREGYRFPLQEEDITYSGVKQLSDDEWHQFYQLLAGGSVKSREENLSSGSKGPWTYLYWENDQGKIQQFTFENSDKAASFKEKCQQLRETMIFDDPVKTVATNNGPMDYLHFGNSAGRKLVILPGLALKSVMDYGESIIAAYGTLGEIYDIYLFDHVRNMPEDYTISEMAEDTVEAIEQLGLAKVSLMGVSMGGMVSEMIAIEYPELVESLVLCSTTSRIVSLQQQQLANWKQLAENRDTSALMEAFGESVYSPAFYQTNREAIIASGEGAQERDYRNFVTAIDAVSSFDIYDQLTEITCPVLVIGAGEDKVVGVQASYDMAEKLNCSCYIYEGYGHGVYDEAPDYLNHVRDFLSTVK